MARNALLIGLYFLNVVNVCIVLLANWNVNAQPSGLWFGKNYLEIMG